MVPRRARLPGSWTCASLNSRLERNKEAEDAEGKGSRAEQRLSWLPRVRRRIDPKPPKSHILHPTPHTLHHSPYTLHPTPYTPHLKHLKPTPEPFKPHSPHPTTCVLAFHLTGGAMLSQGPCSLKEDTMIYYILS